MEKDVFMDPASKEFGVDIVNTSPTNYAKFKAMVEGGSVEWDLVTVGGRFIFQGHDQGLLEPIDYTVVDVSQLGKEWYAPYGVYTSTGATIMAWNTNAFPADKGPSSWKDFWDVKNFPGARGLYKPFLYNYEAALRAADVKREEVYPVTPEKVKLAIAKLTELKPHVKLWWTSGAQPPQLLTSGELALSAAWNGRIIDVQREKAPVAMTYKDGLAWGNAWVLPKGSAYKDVAMKIINYAITAPVQSRLVSAAVYGPVLAAAAAKATPEQQALLVTSPQNAKDMLVLDQSQTAVYSSKYEEEWNQFQLG